MSSFLVWVPVHGEDALDGEEFEADDIQDAARMAAEKWHSKRDGWEWSYPITFRIADEHSVEFDVSIERDFHPVFIAAKPMAVAK